MQVAINLIMPMRTHLIFALLALLPPSAQVTSTIPNDCWFGVLVSEQTHHGQLVATGPVTEWRVGVPVVLYPTKEDYAQINAFAEKGQMGTFDTSRPMTVVPTWISGPGPGDRESGEDKSIRVMMQYRNAECETGVVDLTYWTSTSGKVTSLLPDQTALIAEIDQQLHDMSCRGIP
jgi:hypothetical protein